MRRSKTENEREMKEKILACAKIGSFVTLDKPTYVSGPVGQIAYKNWFTMAGWAGLIYHNLTHY